MRALTRATGRASLILNSPSIVSLAILTMSTADLQCIRLVNAINMDPGVVVHPMHDIATFKVSHLRVPIDRSNVC